MSTEVKDSPACISDEQIQQITGGIKIPAQPELLLEIEKLLANDASSEHIADAVMKDVSISAKIISIVNSPAFGLTEKISSLRQAVMLFGISGLTNLVRVTMLRDVLGDSPTLGAQFWNRCMGMAQSCAHVSLHVVCSMSPDDGYTLGLFHKCGMPLLADKYEDYDDSLISAKASSDNLISVEEEKYSINHCTIGSMVAKTWGLPEHLWSTIRNQNVIGGEDLSKRTKDMVCALHLSTWLAEGYFEKQPLSDQDFLFFRDTKGSDDYYEGFVNHFDLSTDELADLQSEINDRLELFFQAQW